MLKELDGASIIISIKINYIKKNYAKIILSGLVMRWRQNQGFVCFSSFKSLKLYFIYLFFYFILFCFLLKIFIILLVPCKSIK